MCLFQGEAPNNSVCLHTPYTALIIVSVHFVHQSSKHSRTLQGLESTDINSNTRGGALLIKMRPGLEHIYPPASLDWVIVIVYYAWISSPVPSLNCDGAFSSLGREMRRQLLRTITIAMPLTLVTFSGCSRQNALTAISPEESGVKVIDIESALSVEDWGAWREASQ